MSPWGASWQSPDFFLVPYWEHSLSQPEEDGASSTHRAD
jgi:hypothetical protein